MDNEMIERVVKASFDAWNKQRGLSFTVDDMSDDEKEWAKVHAIAIIKAMREPTEKMLENSGMNNAVRATATYQNMIDAIINE